VSAEISLGDVALGGAAVAADPAAPVVVRAPGGRRRRRPGALHRAQARQRHPPRPVVQQGRQPANPLARLPLVPDLAIARGL